jgi:oligoendopeptidase F
MMNDPFIHYGFVLKFWDDVKPKFEDLESRQINNYDAQVKWISDRSSLDAFLSEDLAWRYINYTRYTTNNSFKSKYEYFINEIQPEIARYDNILNKKLLEHADKNNFKDEAYGIYFRSLEQDIKLFREENIPLFTKIDLKANEYSELMAGLSINYNKKTITLQQASAYMESSSRKTRKTVFEKIKDERLKHLDKIDETYSELVKLRQQVAVNAGHVNYRDYAFESMCRFDYNIEQNLELLDSIRDEIIPVIKILEERRRKKLNVRKLRPYDLNVDIESKRVLKPFKNSNELIDKSISCFNNLGHNLGSYLQKMKELKLFDLDSRKGKAPGGYNYPLDRTGAPFIFMNSALRLGDMVTLMHEGGHAVHSFLSHPIGLVYFKHPPSEVAELASMSMELLTMEHWNVFFRSDEDLRRAKLKHLTDILGILPWIAIIDKFQHWVYTHPGHSVSERLNSWQNIYNEYATGLVEWKGYENYRNMLWQKQGHLFDVPFYYIEYAIAQLGAVAIWKNYKSGSEKTISRYMSALSLGYTCSVPKIYDAAGIKFDFSKSNIHSLAGFLLEEIENLS